MARDDDGRLYLCDERDRWIVRGDPRSGQVERLSIDWRPVKRYFDEKPLAAAHKPPTATMVVPRYNLPKYTRIREQDVDEVQVPVKSAPQAVQQLRRIVSLGRDRLRRLRPRSLGIQARITLAFALGAMLLSAILAGTTFALTRANLLSQRESNALGRVYINANLVKSGVTGQSLEQIQLKTALRASQQESVAGFLKSYPARPAIDLKPPAGM